MRVKAERFVRRDVWQWQGLDFKPATRRQQRALVASSFCMLCPACHPRCRALFLEFSSVAYLSWRLVNRTLANVTRNCPHRDARLRQAAKRRTAISAGGSLVRE